MIASCAVRQTMMVIYLCIFSGFAVAGQLNEKIATPQQEKVPAQTYQDAESHIQVQLTPQTDSPVAIRQAKVFELIISSDFALSDTSLVSYVEPDNTLIVESYTGLKEVQSDPKYIYKKRFTVYPLSAGKQKFPALNLRLVNASSSNKTADSKQVVTLRTESQSYRVNPVPALEADKAFIVSNDVSLQQDLSASLKQNQAVGDALTRTITLSATNVPAMLMPELTLETPKGVKVYHNTPEVKTLHNEEDDTVKTVRTEQITYLFEQKGHYVLPEYQLAWWNPQTGSRQVLTLPSYPINVGKPSFWQQNIRQFFSTEYLQNLFAADTLSSFRLPVWLLILLLLAVVLIGISKYRRQSRPSKKRREKNPYRQYLRCFDAQEYGKALNLLYQLAESQHKVQLKSLLGDQPELQHTLQLMMQAGFSTQTADEQINKKQALKLFKAVLKHKQPKPRTRFTWSWELNN